MTGVENVTEPPPANRSTLRVRRHRERRREGLRLLTLEMPQPAIDAAIARGFLKPEETTQSWSVIESVYATQLSETALNWLIDNGVITTEERTNAATILRGISDGVITTEERTNAATILRGISDWLERAQHVRPVIDRM
jgi:hypothetical protein